MVEVNQAIVELVRPACDIAVSRAIHTADPEEIHSRISGQCPFCPTLSDRMREVFTKHSANSPAFKSARERLNRIMANQDAADGVRQETGAP